MNIRPNIKTGFSVCPHDCPSTCALEVELLDANTIGRVRGAEANSYTAGVICEKVGRYAERVHHPDRLLYPMIRKGKKGAGDWQRISWDDALDEVAQRLLKVEADYGTEAVWPYYYAGTMGLVMRDGLNRLTHAKKYSRMYDTFCVTLAWPGIMAGVGRLAGSDPREMAKADVVVIWGTNPVHTQVNVMTHAIRGRKNNGAKIVVVDVYETATMKQADMGLVLRPGTDGALACAVMHILFRDDKADWAYMEKYTDDPKGLEQHLETRGPDWAAKITGLSVEKIEAFAALLGENKRSYLRLGYGFTRQRNGAVNMHAAASIAAVLGSWPLEGGGAFHNNGGIYRWDKTMIEGLDMRDSSVRWLDQSRIGPVLTGECEELGDGPPVKAIFIQNTNPVSVAPEQEKVKRGFARDDLFVCVHEQFMTETAQLADVVLPATMFLEHDDLYQSGGHQHILLGPKLIEPAGECRSNHEVICALAKRLGGQHPGFDMTARELIDWTLVNSGRGGIDQLEQEKWFDVQPDFAEAHYLNGFAHPDGKYRFAPDWKSLQFKPDTGSKGPVDDMPAFPDHWGVIREATSDYPFRLATSPARAFLNSTFNETPTSLKREKRPSVMMHPEDMATLGLAQGDLAGLSNQHGTVKLHVESFSGIQRGVVVAESIWPNEAYVDGHGINTLTGADSPAPVGGAGFHDNHVQITFAGKG